MHMETLRIHLQHAIDHSGLSIRELAQASGVRRQSISTFLRGGNIHLRNLSKLLSHLKQQVCLSKKVETQLSNNVAIDQNALTQFCTTNQIRLLAVFGSALREDFCTHSDIDILIAPTAPMTLFTLSALEETLQHTLATTHPIHLITVDSLSPLIAQDILNSAEVLYEQ